jgi:hypothetical protein
MALYLVADLTHLCPSLARRTTAESLLSPNDRAETPFLPRLRWLWGCTYDCDEMISDLR